MIGRLDRLPLFYRLKPHYDEPSDKTINDEELAGLTRAYPDTRALDLSECHDLADASITSLRRLRKLHALNLSGTRITSAALASLATFPSLRIIVLNGTAIDDDAVARLIACRRFREISLNQTSIGNDALTNGRGVRLRRLGLNGTAIDDRGAASLAKFGYIGVLGVQGTRVGDEGIAKLAGRDMTWTLQISDCGITNAGFLFLARMRNLRQLFCERIGITDSLGELLLEPPRNLEIFDAAHTGVGDATIARIASCHRLGRLRLQGTRVSDASLPYLLRIPRLDLLDVRDSAISLAGQQALSERFGRDAVLRGSSAHLV